jgi:hypothetical protein|eukprot:COSAG02_NODE_41_length_47431_cov_32.449204_29_plen_117_part_00
MRSRALGASHTFSWTEHSEWITVTSYMLEYAFVVMALPSLTRWSVDSVCGRVTEMMDDLAALRAKAPWRVRLACLPFVQAAGFLHAITIPPRRPSSLLTIVEKSLGDSFHDTAALA